MGALLQQGYSDDGLLASLTDANGNTTGFDYDGLNRLSEVTYPGGSMESYAYDDASNVTSLQTRRNDAISYAYDTLNRRCTKTIGASPTSCTASSSMDPAVWYSYDLNGRLTHVRDNGSMIAAVSDDASYTTGMAYDALNRPTHVTFGDAPAQTAPSDSTVTFAHVYDQTNRRVRGTATDDSWWSSPSSPGSTSYTANALNQYSAVDMVTPTYDGNGNLTFDGTYTYAYDAENRLTTVTQGMTTIATYEYDAQGRRKSKTVGMATTIYVTDADGREVLEYDGSTGDVLGWYAYGLGPNDVLNRMDVAGGTRETLIPDIQGSVVGTLESSTGALSKSGYQAYGESGSTAGSFRYTGQRIDAETDGLYYYRARMYTPVLGRFLQPDPIGYAAGANLYAYVGNDPLNATDPTGLVAEQIGESVRRIDRDITSGLRRAVHGDPLGVASEWSQGLMFLPGVAGVSGLVADLSAEVRLAGSIRNVNPTRGTMNCVNCAIAADATLAGRQASALPGGATSIGVLENEFGATFQSVSGPIQIGSILSASGSGARGIVFGESLAAGQPGHVFNVINQGGNIRFLDAQSGTLGVQNFNNLQNFRFLLTNPGTP